MRKFVDAKKYGILYIDKILFESAYPIIFTAKNQKEELFLCVCCQGNEKGFKWLVGKTDPVSIIDMLQDKITVRDVLLKKSFGKISVDYDKEGYRVDFCNSDWDDNSYYLPKKDSYMFADEHEFDEEIAYFTRMIPVEYHKSYIQYDIEKKQSIVTNSIDMSIEIPEVFIKVPNYLPTYKRVFKNTFEVLDNNLNNTDLDCAKESFDYIVIYSRSSQIDDTIAQSKDYCPTGSTSSILPCAA